MACGPWSVPVRPRLTSADQATIGVGRLLLPKIGPNDQ